jgi:hypothetical protein
VVPGPPTDPTEGHCDVGFAFHIQEGDFGGVSLNNLIFVVIAYTPGNMGAGNWTTAVYIDEKANDAQRKALGRILSGEIGGPAQRWRGELPLEGQPVAHPLLRDHRRKGRRADLR